MNYQGEEPQGDITRIIGGYEFVSTPEDRKRIKEAEALLHAYVDAMMPADLYNEEARTKAFQTATWAVQDVLVYEGESEFGTIVGDIHGGNIILADEQTAKKHGKVVFISSAFNPLTAKQLREIAKFMKGAGNLNPLEDAL